MEFQYNYPCPFAECGKNFRAKKSLTEHVRIHSGEKPYGCRLEGCNKRFTQYSSMQKHERTHTGAKPYKCGLCDKDFTQISNLKRHERVHAGEKPHECEACMKRFSTASNLKQHMLVHQKDVLRYKFACMICHKSYLYRSSLKKHLLEHGIHPSEVDMRIETEIAGSEDFYVKEENYEEEEEEEFSCGSEASKRVFIDPSESIKANPIECKTEYNEAYSSAIFTLNGFSAPSMPQQQREQFQRPTFNENQTKMLSLTDLIGSPLRDDPRKESSEDSFSMYNKPMIPRYSVNYQGEIYYLYDRTLNRIQKNGQIEIRGIDIDHVNPVRCLPVTHVTGFSACDGADNASNHAFNGEIENLDFSVKSEENGMKGSGCGHVHGPNCGHAAIMHGTHLDYIVNGTLHHCDGDHCDDHGPISINKNVHDDGSLGLTLNKLSPFFNARV